MSDINPVHRDPVQAANVPAGNVPTAPIESDGVSYRGVVWFVVILAVTTIICEVIVVGMFKVFEMQGAGAARAPLAAPAGTLAPPPNLLMNEPASLQQFRTTEESVLHSYGWQDKNAGVVRLPIERAKALLLERGLPTRGGPVVAEAKVASPVAPKVPPQVVK